MSKLTDFLPGLAPDLVLRVARTSNVQITAASKGNFIDITSGTFTQTFAAAAALGNGWHCYIRNSGSGNITIPSSDGRTNWIMYPGEMRLFLCDGSVLRSVVLTPFSLVFTSSGNFIKPPGYSAFEGLLWGGGGGGHFSICGGGGGCSPISVAAALLADSTPAVVGAGGEAISSTAGDGGTSSFSGFEASGGRSGYAQGVGGSPGSLPRTTRTERNSIYGGSSGGNGTSTVDAAGHSIYGGGGGGFTDTSLGKSVIGGNGGSSTLAAQAPGGGGGRERPGARGEIRIWGVI